MSLRPASEQPAGPRHPAHLQHAAARRLLVRLQGEHAAGAQCPRAVLLADDFGDIREASLEALIAADVMDPAGGGNSREAHVNDPSTTKLPR